MATFSTTQRGARKLHYQGYSYSKHRENEGKINWRCERFQNGCQGRLISNGDTIIVTENHNDHQPSPCNVQRAKIKSNIKAHARNNRDAPRTIINESLAGASDATIVG